MKLTKLHNPLNIEKETTKAVFILPSKIDMQEFEKINNFVTAIKQAPFSLSNGVWFPKSQIEICNGKIVSVAYWLYKKCLDAWDIQILSEDDFLRFSKK